MNQILITNINKNQKNFIKIIFKTQLIFSISIITILILFIIFTFLSTKKSEIQNNKLIQNYNIYKLYNTTFYDTSYQNVNKNNSFENDFLGTIEIKKLNLIYPVFSTLTEEKLLLSPCKFFGPSLGKNGNICIAGHNYDNNKFFSNLNKLNINDTIIIYDNLGKKNIYTIFKKYEVKENDLSPIYDYNSNNKELTLFTCNNVNKNRLIIKAKCN